MPDPAITEYRNDGVAMNALVMLNNRMTGLGVQGRDKYLEHTIALDFTPLTRPDLQALYRKSKICEKVVDLLPKAATAENWIEVTIGKGRKGIPAKAVQYSEDLKLRSAIREASIMGRLDGDGFVIVGVDDGGEPWEPVNEGRIRKISWVYPVDRWRIFPETNTGRPGYPELYTLYLPFTDALPNQQVSGKIHRSRVLRFPGKKLWGDMITYNTGFNDSVLQTFFQSFVKYLIAIEYSTRMVQDYNVFTYKLQGLAKLILAGDQEKIFHRFQAILMSMSSLGGLAMDADQEDAQFISRNFSGLDALIDRLKDDTSAAAAMPPTQLWGSSQKSALSNSSEGDKYAWADCVADYRSEIMAEPIADFFRLVLLAQNGPTGGRLPESWGVTYRSALRLNLKEQTALRKDQTMGVDVPSVQAGILLKEEVRESAWSGNEYTIERQLQPDLWAKQQAEAETEEAGEAEGDEGAGGENPDASVDPNLEPRTDDATPAKRIIDWHGLKLGLQYQPFDIRHGKVLPVAYGHIQKTRGADGMACDCYVGSDLESDRVFEITQLVNGAFDEHKYMLGFDSLDAARETFLKVMPGAMFGGIREVGLAGLEPYRLDGGSEGTNPKAPTGGTSRIDAVNPVLSLIDRADKHLQGLEDSAIERVNSALESSYQDLEAQILRSYSQETPGSLMARDRAAVLLSQVADLLGLINTRNAEDIQQAFEDLLRGADAQGTTLADDLARAIANQQLQATANVPIAAIVNQATEGMTRLRKHTEAFADKASTIVTQGLIQGFGTDKIASLLQKEMGLVRHKAETIARTESLSATNAAAKANYQANGLTLGTWQATADDRLCPTCGARNQNVYKLKDIVIPAHPRCLPGDVVVSGANVQAGTSRQYTGEVVVIQTASGKELTATPNHPVLTDQGWVALDLIQKGDHVFSSVNGEDISAAIAPDDYQCPTRISEVVAAFREASSVVSRSVKVSPEDFHGDGKGSEVCVVSADRLLWDEARSQFVEPGVQLPFKRRLIGEQSLFSQRLLALGFPSQNPSLRCGMCGSGLPSPLLRSHIAPLEALSLGSASDLNSSRNQVLTEKSTTNTQLLGQSVFGSPSHILCNSKINVDTRNLAPDLHPSFDQAIVDSGLTHAKLGRQTHHRPSSSILGDDVAIVERENLSAKLDTSSLEPVSHAIVADTSISSQLPDGLPSIVSIDGLSVSNLSSGSIMHVDASSLEMLVKSGGINAELFGDRGDGGSSFVCRDEVIHVERKPFDGHVYNLETKTGWYFANNIVTHNCRCFISPISQTWLDLGLVDTAWAADFRARSLAELAALGLEPDYGRSAFEKANGLDAPEPVWEPEARSDSFECDEWREDAGTPCGKGWIKAGHKCSKGVSSSHPSANPNHAGHAAYQGALAAARGKHTHAAAHSNHPDHAAYKAAHDTHGGKAPLPSGGGTPAKTAAKTPAKKASAKPKATKQTTDGFPADVSKLEHVKSLGGSTGASLVRDPATGKQYVLKQGGSPEHLRSEFAADRAYEAMGVNVPKGKLYETAHGVAKLTEHIEGKSLADLHGKEREQAIAELQKHFAADALLGNWDAIGMAQDNVLVDKSGKVYRVDNGGALKFRAQGKEKTADQWNEHPTELWSMRDGAQNPSAGAVFGQMSLKESLAGVPAIAAHKKALLAALPEDVRGTVQKRLETMSSLHKLDQSLSKAGQSSEAIDSYAKTVVTDMKAGTAIGVPTATAAKKAIAQSPPKKQPEDDDDLDSLFGLFGDDDPSPSTKAGPIATSKQVKAVATEINKGGFPGMAISPTKKLTTKQVGAIDQHFQSGETSDTFHSFKHDATQWGINMSQPDWQKPPPPPSAAELASINYYTGHHYGKLNTLLRKHGDGWTGEVNHTDLATPEGVQRAKDDALKITALVNSGLAQLPNHEGTVYRGTTLPKNILAQYEPGKTVTEHAFTSTSTEKSSAFGGNVHFQITSKKGARIERFSYFKKEHEVLFGANTKFKVTKKYNEGGKTIIHMTEV